RPCAELRATARGFALVPREGAVRLLEPPVESPNASALALLSDGEAWSTSALALVMGTSQRTAQRALGALADAGQARAMGRGRARRWLAAPIAAFATTLLLPGPDGSV
ncbi:MAG TPA: helix-turn-helix domain-containing protein, partial [Anaeromyxobacteraceae bacterium]|nr:helix-turn-helix domain-containing protein [Anaeromyxobacteraceae bacterium]